MAKELTYNDIIGLFKKAETDLNDGWYMKQAWHDLCYAFNTYKICVKESDSLDKMILDNMIVQTISNMYLKIRARKKSEDIKRVDDIFYLVGFAKVQMYLGKIGLTSPIIDKIYEDLENYFNDPEFFSCLAEGVLDEVDARKPLQTSTQTPNPVEETVADKVSKPKKKPRKKAQPLVRDEQNLFYIMSRYCMKGMDLTEGALDKLLGSKNVGCLKSYVCNQFSWTKWTMQRLVLIYLYGGEKITARAFRESILELINEEFKKAGGAIRVTKRMYVAKVDAINALDNLFPTKELRFIIDYGNQVVRDRYNKFLETGVTLTEEQKEFFSKFPSVTAPKPDFTPVVSDTSENRITTTYTAGPGKQILEKTIPVSSTVSLATTLK